MHAMKLNVQDEVFEKVTYFLSTLKEKVEVVESSFVEDLSYLQKEIEIGLASGVSPRDHKEIVQNIKQKYAQS